MTTVLAAKNDEGVIMAGDTRSSDSSSRPWYAEKIKQVGAFLVGGAGDARASDAVLHLWKPPKITIVDQENLLHFMVSKVVPSLRDVITNNYTKAENGDGWAFIIVVGGEIFHVEDDYSVVKPLFDAGSIGSGGQYALGAYRSGANIQRAMEVAAENDPATGAPFTYLTQTKRG